MSIKFGDLLQRHIGRRDINNSKLAKALEIDRSTVGRMISGEIPPKHDIILRIAHILELTKDERAELLRAAGYEDTVNLVDGNTSDEAYKSQTKVDEVTPKLTVTRTTPQELRTVSNGGADGTGQLSPTKLMVGLSIITIIALVVWRYSSLIMSPDDKQTSEVLLLSPSSPTITPTSTLSLRASILTPTPIPTAKEGETLILIATFHGEAAMTDEPHVLIQREIQKKAKNLGEEKVRVALESIELKDDQQAEAETLGKFYNASIVIWGESTDVQTTVNFLNLRQPDLDAATAVIYETERTKNTTTINPKPYNQFITNELPGQLSFLSLFAVGQAYYINQDYSRAITVTEQAINSLNNMSDVKIEGLTEAYFRLGWLYQVPNPNNLNQAIASYDKAIELGPNNGNAYVNRGAAYHDQDNLEAASADFNKAIQLNPDDSYAYLNRGVLYYSQDNLEAAFADFDKAIQLDPNMVEAYINRGTIYSLEGELNQSIIDYDKAIELKPDSAEAYFGRGIVLKTVGKLNDAIDDYNKAINLKVNYAEAYWGRGGALKALGKLEEAIIDFSKAIELKPDFAEAYHTRGIIFANQGQYDTAIIDFDQAIKLQPDNAKAYYNRGLVYHYRFQSDPLNIVDLASALNNYDKAIELQPEYVAAYVSRGLVFQLLGKLFKATDDYNKAIELNPSYAEAYLKRASLYQDEGMLSEALSDFQHYLELEPNTHYKAEVEQTIAQIESELAKQN